MNFIKNSRIFAFAKRAYRSRLYWIPHVISRAIYRLYFKNSKDRQYDLVFIHPEGGGGWILEGICREIARYFNGTWTIHHSRIAIPTARAYFVAHYSMLPQALKLNPWIQGRPILVWYTHPRHFDHYSPRELTSCMKRVTQVIATCSQFVKLLRKAGVPADKVTTVLGGADPKLFPGHSRTGQGYVGFSTAYYERKNPQKIHEIIRAMPHRKFLLLGRGWEEYPAFAEMKALPNLTYVEAPYSDYPQHYAKLDVFVTVSQLEGGPIPLLETMMENAVPVASRTGFAPDLIRHGENGFLFDVNATASEICALIDSAFELKTNVRATVERYSWEAFSKELQQKLGLHRLEPQKPQSPRQEPSFKSE